MDFQPTPFQVSTADARASYTERQLGFPTASSSALAAPTDLACSSSNGTTATPATTTDVPGRDWWCASEAAAHDRGAH